MQPGLRTTALCCVASEMSLTPEAVLHLGGVWERFVSGLHSHWAARLGGHAC